MSFTGNHDVDIIIVSFCDSDTILILLTINKKLVYDAKNEILKQNKDNAYELANLVAMSMDKGERELAKYFLIQCKTEDDDQECQKVLFDNYQPDILEIFYFFRRCQWK